MYRSSLLFGKKPGTDRVKSLGMREEETERERGMGERQRREWEREKDGERKKRRKGGREKEKLGERDGRDTEQKRKSQAAVVADVVWSGMNVTKCLRSTIESHYVHRGNGGRGSF